MNNYGIHPEYLENPPSETTRFIDSNEISEEWQYHVYELAASLLGPDDSVLDYGCGQAFKLAKLIGPKLNSDYCRIVGVDLEESVAFCRSKWDFGEFYTPDDFETFYPIGSPDRFFNVVICSDVIEHLVDPDALLEGLLSLDAKRGGTTFILSTPCREFKLGPKLGPPENLAHIREWTFSEFRSYVESKGFETIYHVLAPDRLFPDGTLGYLTNQILVCRVK